MSADMTRNLAFTVCTTGGCTATVVQKRGSVSERFNHGLENEYQSQIDSETWGDNNARGDNKVDNKVDNNARGDIKGHVTCMRNVRPRFQAFVIVSDFRQGVHSRACVDSEDCIE